MRSRWDDVSTDNKRSMAGIALKVEEKLIKPGDLRSAIENWDD